MPKNESEHLPGALCRVAAVLVAAATLAGCGITDTDARPAGQPVQGGLTQSSGSLLRVYFVTPEGTWPVSRPAASGDRLQQAMAALLAGPTAAERARGLNTRLPPAPGRSGPGRPGAGWSCVCRGSCATCRRWR
jgi:hypothetical protein